MPEPRYSVDPVAKTIDFTKALTVDRLSLGDIYQLEKNFQYQVIPPSDVFQVEPGMPPNAEQEKELLMQDMNEAYRAYTDLRFNTTGTSMNVLPDTEHYRIVYPNVPKLKPGFQDETYDAFLDFPEGRVRAQTEAMEAENFPYAKTKDGFWVPTRDLIKNGSYVTWQAGESPDDPNFYWKEVSDKRIVNAEHLRTIFGPEKLNSKWLGSIARSFYAGAWGYTVKAAGGFVGTLGDIVYHGAVIPQGLVDLAKNIKIEGEDAPWWKDFERYTLNAANYNIHRNYDERMGFFDDINSALWSVFNIAGQAASIVATSAITYGGASLINVTGRAAGFSMAGFSRAMMGMNVVGKNSPLIAKISRQAGLTLGGLEAAAMMKEEVRRAGGSEADADMWALPFFVATYLSESILSLNMLSNMSNRALGKYTIARVLNHKNAINTEAKQKIIDGVIPTHIGKQNAIQRMRDAYLKAQYGVVNWLDDNAVAKYTLGPILTGVEETIEEINENVMYMGVSALYNTVQEGVADVLHAKYRGLEFTENTQRDIYDGDYLVRNEMGRVIRDISAEEYKDIKDELSWLDKYNRGETKLDTEFHGEELVSIFLGSMLTGGLGALMVGKKKKHDDVLAITIANDELLDPEIEKRNKETEKWLAENGKLGNTEYSSTKEKAGTIREDGSVVKSEAQERIDMFRAKVDLYKDLIKTFGLHSKEVLDAVNHDSKLLARGISLAEEISERKNADEALKAGQEFDGKYYKKGQKAEENRLRLEEAQKEFNDLTVVEKTSFIDADGKKHEFKRSKAYHRLFMSSALINDTINFAARQMALKEPGVKDAFGKEDYDAKFAEAVAEKKRELLKFYQRGMGFDYADRYLKAHAFEFDTDGTLANGLMKATRAVVDRRNAILQDMLDADDTVLGEGINTIIKQLNDAIPDIIKLDQLNRNGVSNEDEMTLKMNLQNSIMALGQLMSAGKSKQSIGEMLRDHMQMERHKTANGLAMKTQIDWQGWRNINELYESLDEITQATLGAPLDTDIYDSENYQKIDFDTAENLSDDIKMEAIVHYFNAMTIPDETSNLSQFLAENAQIARSKSAVFEDAVGVGKRLDVIEQYLDIMSIFFDANLHLIQNKIEKNADIAENSPLIKENKIKYNQTQINEAEKQLQRWRDDIDAIRPRLKQDKQYIELDYQKKKIASLSVDLAVMETLSHNFSDQLSEKERKLIADAIDDIGDLLQKGKIGRTSPNRTYKIGEKEYEVRDFKDLYLAVVKTAENDEEIYRQLKSVIYRIERVKNDLYDALGGKLDKVLDKFKTELEKHLEVTGKIIYNDMAAFSNVELFDQNIGTLDGDFSKENFEIGRNEYLKFIQDGENKTPNLKFFTWQFSTLLNRINRAGQNGAHKYKDVYRAIAKYQKDIKGQEILTYEQEQVVLHMLMFSESPQQSLTKNNILNVLGYNGTGKSTIVLRNFFGAKAKLSGKPTKVLFVAPTIDVYDIHGDAIKDLGTLVNANRTFTHSLDAKEVLNGKYDLIIIDEASIIPPAERITPKGDKTPSIEKTIIEISKSMPVMTLGDDAQVMPMFTYHRGKRDSYTGISFGLFYNAERTYPLTKIWRSAQVSHYNLFSYYRSNYIFAGKSVREKLDVKGEWKVLANGKLGGLKYYKDERSIIKDFLDDVKSGASVKDAMLIVLSDQEKEELFNSTEFPELKDYGKYIRTVEYNPTLILKDSNKLNDAISGTSARRVYVAGVLEREYNNPGSITAINSGGEMVGKNEQAGRAMLTAVSRGKEFIGLIGNEALNIESTKTDTELLSGGEQQDMSTINNNKWTENNRKGGRFEQILGEEGIIEDAAEKTQAEEANDGEELQPDIDAGQQPVANDLRLLNTSRKDVEDRALPILTSLKGPIAENVNHLTELLNPPGEASEFSRMEKRLLRDIFEAIIEGKDRSEILEKTIEHISRKVDDELSFAELFNQLYSEAKPYNNEHIARIYISAVQLSHDMSQVLEQGVPVTGLSLSYEDNGTKYYGHPYLLDVVGYEERKTSKNGAVESTIVPVVDLHEINILSKKGNIPKDPSDYTMRKIGAYVIALQRNGIKVNRVHLHNMNIKFKDQETDVSTTIFAPEQVLSAVEKAATALNIQPEPSEQYFPAPEAMESFMRINRSVYPDIEIDDQLIHTDGTVYTVVEKFSMGGLGGLQLMNESNGEIIETINLDNYSRSIASYLFTDMFRVSALEYDASGSMWSSNAVIIDHPSLKGLKNVYHIVDKEGNVNDIMLGRQFVLQYLSSKVPIIKKFADRNYLQIDPQNGNIIGALKSKGNYDKAIVNVIDPDYVESFIEESPTLYNWLSGEEQVSADGLNTAVKRFNEFGLDVISFDGLVDYDYGISNTGRIGISLQEAISKNAKLNTLVDNYMASGEEADLNAIFDAAFPDNNTDRDKSRSSLINFNKEKLRIYRILSNGERVSGVLRNMSPGHLQKGQGKNIKTSLKTFIKDVEATGAAVERDNQGNVIVYKSERYRYIKIKRSSGVESINDGVVIHGKRLTKYYIGELRRDIENFYDLIVNFKRVYKEALEAAEANGVNLKPTEKKAMYSGVFSDMRKLKAYRFLQANESVLSQELAKENSPLHNYLFFDTRNGHHMIELKGRTFDRKYKTFKAWMKYLGENYDKHDGSYVTKLRMHFDEMGDDTHLLVEDNAEVNGKGYTHASLFIMPEYEDQESTMDNLFMTSLEPSFELPQGQAIDQLRFLLGNIADSTVFFNENFPQAPEVMGYLDRFMKIHIREHMGLVDKYVARHEAHHFLMLHILNPEAYGNVIREAVSILKEKGLNYSEKDALEYLADIFMTGEYQQLKPKSWVKRFILWLKEVLNLWKNHRWDIYSSMTAFDKGYFRNRSAEYDNYSSVLYMRKGRYNNPKGWKGIRAKLSENDAEANIEVNHILRRYIQPLIAKSLPNGIDITNVSDKFTDVLSAIQESFRKDIENEFGVFNTALSEVSPGIWSIDNASKKNTKRDFKFRFRVRKDNHLKMVYSDEITFAKENRDNTITKDNPLKDILDATAEDYLKARAFEHEFDENTAAIKKYIYKVLGNLRVDKDGMVVYDMNNLMFFLQTAFGNDVPLDHIVRGQQVKTAKSQFTSVEQVSHKSMLNDQLKMIIESIPLRYYRNDTTDKKDIIATNSYYGKGAMIDMDVVDKYASHVVRSMKKEQAPMTMFEFFKRLNIHINYIGESYERDIIYTFVTTFGSYPIRFKNQFRPEGAFGTAMYANVMYDSMKEDYAKYYIGNKIKDRAEFETLWARKKEAWRDLLIAMDSYFFSETQNIKENVNTQFQTVNANAADILAMVNGNVSAMLKGNNFNFDFGINSRIERLLGESKLTKKEKESGAIHRLFFDEKGIYYFENDQRKTLIHKNSEFTYFISPDLIPVAFELVGYDLTATEIKSIILSHRNYDAMGSMLYHMLLGLKTNMMILDEYAKFVQLEPDMDDILRLTKNKQLLINYERLTKHYRGNNMKMSMHSMKISKDSKGLRIPVFSPDDYWRFNLEHVVPTWISTRGYMVDKRVMNIEGEFEQASVPSGYLYDQIADAYNSSVGFAVKRVKQMSGRILKLNENNNIYKTRITFDGLKNIGGREHGNRALKFARMTPYDIMAFLELQMLDEIRKSGGRARIPAIMDTLADKSRQPFAKMRTDVIFEGASVKYHYGKMRGVRDLSINHIKLGEILLSINEYYLELQKIKQENWNAISKMTRSQVELSDYVLDEDYSIIDGKVVAGPAVDMPGNPFVSEAFKELREAVEKKNIYRSGRVIQKIFAEKFKDFENFLNDIKYDSFLFSPLATMTSGAGIEAYEELSAEYRAENNIKDTGKKTVSDAVLSGWLRKKWGTEQSAAIISPDGTWNSFAEVLFFGHIMFNESFNPLVRGTSYHYRDVIDYIKRGTGLIAPGLKTSVDTNLRKTPLEDRIFVINDLEDNSELFGKSWNGLGASSMESLVSVMPWRQYQLYKDFGANLGPIHQGTSKTVMYYFDPVKQELVYLKCAMFHISRELMQYERYRNMVEFGLGKLNDMVFYNFADGEFTDQKNSSNVSILDIFRGYLPNNVLLLYPNRNVPEYEDVQRKFHEYLIANPQYRQYLISYITPVSALKKGSRRIHTVGKGMEDMFFDKKLNNDEHTITVNSGYLRLQQETYQDTEDPYKNIMTQLLYVINAMEHNKGRAEKVSRAIAKSTNDAAYDIMSKISPVASQERMKWLKKEGLARVQGMMRGSKQEDLLQNELLHPDVLRRRHIQTLVEYVNEGIKPKVAGQSYVQSAFYGKLYFDEFGRPFVPRDFIEEPQGMAKRFINSIGYEKQVGDRWVPITNKNELKGAAATKDGYVLPDGAMVRYKPAEVLVSFHQFSRFGILPEMTMRQAMSIRSRNEVADPLVVRSDEYYELYTYGLDAKTIRNIVEQMGPREVWNNLTSGQRNVIYPPYENMPEYSVDNVTDKALTDNIVKYFVAFNMALDLLAVRIPTTIASSGFTARIVGFVNDTQNTIYHSPLKNIIDGSDFDVDALQVYFRKFKDDRIELWDRQYDLEKEDVGNMVFGQMLDYYQDVRNHPFILSKISMKKFIERANRRAKEYNASNLHTYGHMTNINQSSKRLVGHFANLNQFLFTLAYHADIARGLYVNDNEAYKNYFGNVNILIAKDQEGNFTDQAIVDAALFVTNLTNAATDNPKLGGILGMLNINEATSPIIAGLVIMGYNEDQILDILEMPSMKVLSDVFYSKRKADSAFSQPTYKLVGGESVFYLEEKEKELEDGTKKKYMDRVTIASDLMRANLPQTLIRDAAEMGEQLRRLGDISAIQSREFRSDEQRFFQAYENIRTALGITPEQYINTKNILTAKQQAEAYIVDMANPGKYSDTVTETRIRSHFNIQYVTRNTPKMDAFVNAAAQINKFFDYNFTSHNRDLFKAVRLLTGIDRVNFDSFYESMINETDKFLIGAFIDHLMTSGKSAPARLEWMEGNKKKTQVFDITTPEGRYDYVSRFPQYIDYLKHYRYTSREHTRKHRAAPSFATFLHNLRERKAFGYNTHTIIEFPDSMYKTDYEKIAYRKSFETIFDEDKQNLRLYQLLLHGFAAPNGSFGDVIDNVMENAYSEWIKTFDVSEHIDTIARQIVSHSKGMVQPLVQRKDRKTLMQIYDPWEIIGRTPSDGKNKHYPIYGVLGTLKKSKRLMLRYVPSEPGEGFSTNPYDVKDGKKAKPAKYEIISYSTPGYINPYYFKFNKDNEYIDTARNLKAVLDLSRQDMDMLYEEGEIRLKGYNITNVITEDMETDWTALSKNIVDGSQVLLPDNNIATISLDNGAIILKASSSKSIQSNISLTHQRVASDLIEYATRKIRIMFPGINIRYTSNEDPTNAHNKAIAYFSPDGTLWINTDRIQYDTPLHELSHILVDTIWESNPVMRGQLLLEAEGLYYKYSNLRRSIDNNYSFLDHEDKMKEVVSTMIGWRSIKDVKRGLMRMRIDASDSMAEKIWNTIKLFLQDIADYIKGLTKRVFGTDITLEGSIKDLYDTLINDFKSDNKTSGMTSYQYQRLLNGQWHFSQIENPDFDGRVPEINNMMDFMDHLMSPLIYRGRTSPVYSFEEEVNKIKSGQESLGDLGKNGVSMNSDDVIRGLHEKVNNKNNDKRLFDDNIVTWLNQGADNNTFEETFGATEEEKYGEDNIRKLKTAIHYKSTTKYMRYSELAEDPKLKHLYSDALEGYDPIVAIEYNDKDQIIIRLYDLTYDDINPVSMRDPKGNIASRYMNKAIALNLGITHGSDMVNLRTIALGMLGTHLQAVDKKVKVIDMGLMQATKKRPFPAYWVDPIRMRNTLYGLNGIKEFVDRIKSPEIRNLLFKKMRMPDVDYISLLRYSYKSLDETPNELKQFVTESDLDLKETERILQTRLIILNRKYAETVVTGRTDHDTAMEIEMLTNALISMRTTATMDETLNTFNNIGIKEKWLYDSASVGNEAVQTMRELTMNSSRSIVTKMLEWKYQTHGRGKGANRQKGLYDTILEVYHREHPGRERLYEVTGEMFEPLMAKVKDTNGVWRNARFIYWTNDESECVNETERMFARQALELGLSKEMLDVGRAIMEKTTDTLKRLIVHRKHTRTAGFSHWIKSENRPYDINDAEKELFSNSAYSRGMLPVLHKRSAEMIKEGKLSGLKKKFYEITDVHELDEYVLIKEMTDPDLDKIQDRFYDQFGIGLDAADKTVLGPSTLVSNLLGLHQVLVPTGKEGEYSVGFETRDAKANDEVSYDMEKMMTYFLMTAERAMEYETNVLPVANGLKVMYRDMQDGWNIGTEETIKYLNMYTKQAIQGIRERMSKKDSKLEKAAIVGMSAISPLVMMFNINVALVGGAAAGMMSFIEGVNNNFSNNNVKAFILGDLVKANAHIFANWSTVGQLMVQYGVMNMSEYDLMSHRIHEKTKKHPFSSHVSNWLNWASDYYARALIMTAMMIHDDSLKAYEADRSSGKIIYNEKKDGQFFNEQGQFKSEEAEAYYHAVKRKIIKDGIHGQTEDGPLVMGYDKDMARRFKFYADKYAIGAYDNQTRGLLANYVVGRFFTMFATWMQARISNSFSGETYIKDGGRYVMVKDEDGNYIMQWERLMVEGYINTVFATAKLITTSGGFNNLKYMTTVQKNNWNKMVIMLSTFLLMRIIYMLAVYDDKDRRKGKKDIGFIAEERYIKNWLYAAASIFLIPNLLERLNNPIPAVRIVRNTFFDQNGNMRFEFPSSNILKTYLEPFTDES